MRLFPRANTSRLYVTRKDGGRGSISVEDAVDQSILGLKNYVPKNTETLHSAVRVTEECGIESTDHFKKRKQKERKDDWSQKVMHGHFIGQTADVADTQFWPLATERIVENRNREPNYCSPGSGLENKPGQKKD